MASIAASPTRYWSNDMKSHALKAILLTELAGKQTGDAVEIASDRKVTILVHYGDDLVPVAKVRSVRFSDDFVNIVGESEQFFVDPDCDFIVKAEDAQKRDDTRPGFH